MSKIKIIIALSITLLLLAVSCVMAGEEYREDFSKSLPLKAGDRFSLDNVNGSVAVATWKENKVEIKAVKIARRNEKDLKEVEILVEERPGSVSVKAVWPKFPRRVNVNVEFEVLVPEGVVLDEVETTNGGIEITGRFLRIDTGTTNGSVRIEDASGELDASTTNGSVVVSRFEGRIKAGTTNGNVKLEGVAFKDGVSADTTNGSITLAIDSPESLNAELKARTTNGSVSVDFPVTLKNLSQSRRRVEATIGQGGPLIDLETTNGSIRLTK